MPATAHPVRHAVSACVWRGEQVLVVRRAKAPNKGLWSLPGGHVEAGESLHEALARELAEETGLTARILGQIGTRDLAGPRKSVHLHIFNAVWLSGAPVAGDDAVDARWVARGELGGLKMTGGTRDLIELAHRLMSRG